MDVPSGDLTLSGSAPDVAQTTHRSIEIPAGNLLLSLSQVGLNTQLIVPESGNLAFSSIHPIVQRPRVIVVQSARANGPGAMVSVTFPAPPTAGNLLVFSVTCYQGHGTVQSGITYSGLTVDDNTGSTSRTYYRYAQPGDPATFNIVVPNHATYWNVVAHEISGLSGVWETDLVDSVVGTATGNPIVSTPLETANQDDLGLAFFSCEFGGDPTTFGAGWIVDQHFEDVGAYGYAGGHQRYTAPGSTVQINFSYTHTTHAVYIILLFAGIGQIPPGALQFTTSAPTVTQTASPSIEVPSADLVLTPFVPIRQYQVMWTAPVGNPDLLCPTEFTIELVTNSGSGGRSIGGKKQYLQSDAGYWRVVYGGIRIRSNADVLRWREIKLQTEGRANTILIEAFDRKRAPIPIDGSPIVASSNAVAAAGTATVQILLSNGSALVAGMHFSTEQFNLYRIRKVVSQVGNVYTVKVRPPLRRTIQNGETLEFDFPKILVRLETDDQMNIVLDLMQIATPTVAFVEEPVIG